MTDKPIMWKADLLVRDELALPIVQALHREAGKLGYSCMPKRSNINRHSYFAEIMCHTPGRFSPNVAMGTGQTPTEAAMTGYKIVGLKTPLMLAIYLEVEAYYLAQTVKTYGKLEAAMEELSELISGIAVADFIGATVEEDDDL